MNGEQLHYFELAYEERNFSAAARRVPVSPQGLAKAIHALEKELDVPLFIVDEVSGLPVPTEYAVELSEFAAVYHSNLRLLKEAFARIRGQEQRLIRLGCSLGVIGALGPEFLSHFGAAHPNVRIQYWEAADNLVEEGLRAGNYDIALVVGPQGEPGVRDAHTLYRCPIYFWVSSNDLLAKKRVLTMQDIAGYDIAIPGEGFKCYEQLRRMAGENGVELGEIFQMSEIFQLYEFADFNRGLGFTVRHLVSLPIFERSQSVVAIPVEGLNWSFGIERLAAHALGDAEQAFWNWCVSYARRLPTDPLG